MPKIAPIKISKFQLMIFALLLLIAGGGYGYWNYMRIPEYTAWDLIEMQENNPKEFENLKNKKIRIFNAYFTNYDITSSEDAAKYTETKPYAATSKITPFKIIGNDIIISEFNFFSTGLTAPANKVKNSNTFLNIRFDQIPTDKLNSIVEFDNLDYSYGTEYEEKVRLLKENKNYRNDIIIEGYVEDVFNVDETMINGFTIPIITFINFRSTKIISVNEVHSKLRDEVEKTLSIPYDFVLQNTDKNFKEKQWTLEELLKPVNRKSKTVATTSQKEEQIVGVDKDTLAPNKDETSPVEEPIVQNHIGIANNEKVYFYTEPDLLTVRKAFIIKGQEVQIIEKIENFYKVSFTNQNAKITEGYMKVSDLVSRS
jgi:hypothetical protein